MSGTPAPTPSEQAVTEPMATLEVALGSGPSATVRPGLPVLSGDRIEAIFRASRPRPAVGGFHLQEEPGWLVGLATADISEGLEAVTHRLYAALLAAKGPKHLVRVWNYVPAINATGPGELENYRLFCRGRARAFEESYGTSFKAHLPAGSAVGCQGAGLTVVFAASDALPRHVENPLQMPAYDYPQSYGPRAPSFARATVVADCGCQRVFISGTAAIRGHATIAPHQTLAQLDCTLENLQVISRACGLGDNLGGDAAAERHLKIYLRHRHDLEAVAGVVSRQLLRPGDRVAFVESDICRADLNVEIEASLVLPG